MNAVLCLLLLTTGGLDDWPTHLWQTEEPVQEDEPHPGDLLPEYGGVVGVSAIWTSFDSDLGIDDTVGYQIEIQLRFEDVYYYRIGGAYWENETDNLPTEKTVNVWSAFVGIGMDVLWGAVEGFSLDVGLAGGFMDFTASFDSDLAFLLQVEVVARIIVVEAVVIRIGVLGDFVNTSFRDTETDHVQNYSGSGGVDIRF